MFLRTTNWPSLWYVRLYDQYHSDFVFLAVLFFLTFRDSICSFCYHIRYFFQISTSETGVRWVKFGISKAKIYYSTVDGMILLLNPLFPNYISHFPIFYTSKKKSKRMTGLPSSLPTTYQKLMCFLDQWARSAKAKTD